MFNDEAGHYLPPMWGNCGPLDQELAQETFTNSTKTCSKNPFFICTALANYGYIHVDFEARTAEMGIRTPAEGEQMTHKIKY